jgi:hypothetical protein
VGQVVDRSGGVRGTDAAKTVGDRLRSGLDDSSADIDNFLKNTPGVSYPRSGMHEAVSHVETKLAWAMRNSEQDYAEVVINHESGPCGGPYSCQVVVPHILRPGQSMRVFWSDGQGGMMSKLLEGEVIP